jgi:hypothetical protein
VTPLLAGIMFGVGWWLFISAHIVQGVNAHEPTVLGYYYIPGIVATFGLIMTNIVDVSSLDGSSFMAFANPQVSARVRAWLFLSLALHFGALIASIWIMAAIFLPPTVDYQFPGIALALQSTCILFSSMILLWNRASKNDGYDAI